MRIWVSVLALVVCCASCCQFDDWRAAATDRRQAARAWNDSPERFNRHAFSGDYSEGWKHAYGDVANGGTGEVPAVPPQHYWTTGFRNNPGHQRIADWYAGYRSGAAAAKATNVGFWNAIPTSLDDAVDGPTNAQLPVESAWPSETLLVPPPPSNPVPLEAS